jgi:uncharacterized protein (DUF58 family)
MLTQELMREVRHLQIRTRRRVSDLFAGEYHSAFKGRGIEFSDVREYEPGDDVRAIDWNVTARAGKPFIKRFVEERQLTVLLAIDASASGRFASTGRPKATLAAEVGAVLALAAARNNDRAGLLLFTDRVERYDPPRKGRLAVLRVLRDLVGFEPSGRGTDLRVPLEHAVKVHRRRSILFLVSDFAQFAEGEGGFGPMLRRVRQRHEVVAVRITDPRELELPRLGLLDVVDPETGRRELLDARSARVRRAYTARSRAHRAAVEAACRAARVDLVDISTDRPFVHDLAVYFERRERRR